MNLALADTAATTVTLEPGDVILALRKEDARYAVLGDVPRPGMFDLPVRGEVRVLDALEKAGLLTASSDPTQKRVQEVLNDPSRSADLEHARLTRAGHEQAVDLVALLRGDTSNNLQIQAGDVLTVPRRAMIRVYAVGEVHTPGLETLPEKATVLDLLNAAGRPEHGRAHLQGDAGAGGGRTAAELSGGRGQRSWARAT